jgi:hypothetical protein
MQGGAESPRPVVIRRKPPHDRMSHAEVAAYSRRLVASLRTMDHMAPRASEESAQLSFVLASPERTA